MDSGGPSEFEMDKLIEAKYRKMQKVIDLAKKAVPYLSCDIVGDCISCDLVKALRDLEKE